MNTVASSLDALSVMDTIEPAGAAAEASATPASDGVVTTFYQPEGYLKGDSIVMLMKRIVAQLSQDIDARLDDHDLTNAQWAPLLKLHLGKGDTVAELARLCSTDCGAMTRLLDRLEAKGFVRRVRSTADRRVVHLELTADGESIAVKVPQLLCDALNSSLTGFTHDEWQTLKSYLERMVANAEARKSQAAVPPAGTDRS